MKIKRVTLAILPANVSTEGGLTQTNQRQETSAPPSLLFYLCAGQGPTSPVAATSTPEAPASPTSTAARPAVEAGLGAGSDAHPVAQPKQLTRPSRAASGGSGDSSSQELELYISTQEASIADALQGVLSQDNTSSYSISQR